MKEGYRKLGEFIEQTNERNNDLHDYPLLGLSVEKHFFPSIANTVGTDFSKYKIVYRNQFTYIADTSRRGDKIGVALLITHDAGLVSQAYTTFEIKNENQLLPEYLMMWFSRPEFDRYARYHSHGSARETFDWDAMCDVELPVPSPAEQQKIVDQYHSVENKIKTNEAICEKLEAAARALYKHWFVDFQFPNEEGKPYQSSGGKMIWNEELEKEIPEGWDLGSVKKISNKIYSGGTPSTDKEEYWNGEIFWLSSGETGNKFILSTERTITNLGIRNSTTKLAKSNSTVIATAGQGKTRGQSAFLYTDVYINQSIITVEPKSNEFSIFIFLNINSRYDELRNSSDAQSIRGSINSDDIKNLDIIIPDDEIIEEFDGLVKQYFGIIYNKKNQNQKLCQLQDLLLAGMVKIE